MSSQSTTTPNPAVAATDLVRVYQPADSQAVRAPDGASLQAESGEMPALMGPSGSGKTTMLNCLIGLDIPTSGTVKVLGTDVTSLEPEEAVSWRRDSVAVVFQSGGLLPHLTA